MPIRNDLSAPECGHGRWTSHQVRWTPSGSVERAIARHDAKCKRSACFAHSGFLFTTVCCAGCRKKVA